MNLTTRSLLALPLLVLLVGCSSTGQRPATAIRDDADLHFARGEFQQASGYYAAVVDRYPGDWDAQYRYGQCLLELDQPLEARRSLEIAHTRRPQHEGIVDSLAEAIYLVGDEDHLFPFLRERADSTQSVQAYLRLAKYSVEMGDPDSARRALQMALAINEGREIRPYVEAAAFAERIGDVEQAVAHLRAAYEIDPKNEQVKSRLRDLGEIPGPTMGLASGG
jgi:tetratricopeptide (TPR) repeat protein